MSLLLAGVFFADTAIFAEAPILPDQRAPGNRQPLVQETANGIPLVNISAPSAGGVSRNDYDRFNVPEKGGILNNSYTYPKRNWPVTCKAMPIWHKVRRKSL